MDQKQAEALRAPFEANQIGKLPKVTCRDCSQDKQNKCCSKHQKQKCPQCGAWMTTAHVHLDYVGHAAVTDRLLKVDPAWSWEPLALDAHGLPLVTTDKGQMLADEAVALWIKLTVCGVTRLGFGGGKNVKEAIGDALRNAAMRFGVALDLWSKEDLRPEESGEESATTKPANGNGHEAAERARQAEQERKEKAAKAEAEAVDEAVRAMAKAQTEGELESVIPLIQVLSKPAQDRLRAIYKAKRDKLREMGAGNAEVQP